MSHLYLKENGAWTEQNAERIYRKANGQWVKIDWADLGTKNYVFKLLSPKNKIHYVSFGDSIAAGHTINEEWNTNYGEKSQYGVNGNASTAIVPGSYTDLIRNELVSIYGDNRVSVKSFARSGDTVADLMDMLNHAAVRSAIEQADIVTICIGANDVLQPAISKLEEYISTGSLASAEAVISNNMATLNNDSASTSFTSLFNKLVEINPKAKYVFTTVYNPYKYLYLSTGHNGFFGPLLSTIPEMNIDVDKIIEDTYLGGTDLSYFDITKWEWVSIELEIDLDGLIREGLLRTPIIQKLFDRVNNLGSWSENYVTQLNTIIRNKIGAYQATNSNFALAETKAMFDLFPDKTNTNVDVDYSDLVNVEFTRTFDTAQMDWGQLYGGDPAGFWTNLAWKYLSFKNALPSTNVWDYVSFNMNGFAADLVPQIIEKVILPDVDPHPEYRGHEVLKRSFTSVWGLTKYEPNGGESVPGNVVLAQRDQTLADAVWSGYHFEGWFEDSELTQAVNVAELTDYSASHTLADLVNGSSVITKAPKTSTLYAKWIVNMEV